MPMDDLASCAAVRPDGTTAVTGQWKRSAWRLWTLIAAVVLLPAAILAAGAWGTWRLAWSETRSDLIRSVEINADYVSRNLESLLRIAGRITDATAAMQYRLGAEEKAALNRRFGPLVAEQVVLRAVLLLDDAGREILRIEAQPGAAPTPLGGGIREALAETEPGRLAVGESYRGDDTWILPFGLRRRSPGSAVVLLLDAARIAEGLARHAEKPSDTAVLLRRDGPILARYPPGPGPMPVMASAGALARALMGGQRDGLVDDTARRDDHPVVIAFHAVEGAPDLIVASGRLRADIAANWHQALIPLLGVGLPAILALFGLVLVVRRQQDTLEVTLDGLEQRIAERTASLQEGQERLRLAVEAGQLGTWETDLASHVSTRSPRALEIFGWSPDVAVAPFDHWVKRIHLADRSRVLRSWERTVTGRQPAYHEEYRFLRADGNWRWLESHGAPVRTDPETGRILRLAGTIQDITERRVAEERRELLTQEVNHRARNALAIVQAILRLTRAEEAGDFARKVEGRVAALARAQALLAAERWTGAPLAAMLTDELSPFGSVTTSDEPGESRFVLDGPPIFRIRADAVQALGMVFHELATNAVKHGALSVPEGRVAATWRVDEADGLLRMRWQETRGPSPGLPSRRGVGSRVIEATVAGQLGGSVDRRWPDEGLVCDILLPLARVRTDPG